MAIIAVRDGIHTIVATPHCFNGVYDNSHADILEACKKLNDTLQQSKIPLSILPGSEVHFCPEIIDALATDRLMTINDSRGYLLLELPDPFMPQAVEVMLTHLSKKNMTPIIAHPERSLLIQRNPSLLSDFIAAGALSQITASSLTGGFGPVALKCAWLLLKKNRAHVVASDAHSHDFRPPALKQAYKKIAGRFGRHQADWMLFENPRKIIANQPVIKRLG